MKGDRLFAIAYNKAKKGKFKKKEVYDLLFKSYEMGNSKAAYAIGNWHLHGIYVKRDYKRAAEYLRFAADNNHPVASYDLAVSYEKGKGVKKNLGEAFLLYLKSSLLGDRQALVEVGRCYYYGIGTKKDKKLANIFLNRAEELGMKW